MPMKIKIIAFVFSLILNVGQARDLACPDPSSIQKFLNWAETKIQQLLPAPPTKLPSGPEIAEAKDHLSSVMNVKMVSLDHGRSGGMHIVFMGEGKELIPPHASIPRDLWNQPMNQFVFKVTKRGSDPLVVARESVVEKEVADLLRKKAKSKVRNIPTREIYLPDGTRLVIQEKALGQKPLEVIKKHFSAVFTEDPSKEDLMDLLSMISADNDIFKYFEANRGGLGPVQVRYIEDLLEDLHIAPEQLKGLLKKPNIQNLISSLHELRDLAEGEHLPRSRISTSNIAGRNRAFYKNDVTLNGALDMSVDNFSHSRSKR